MEVKQFYTLVSALDIFPMIRREENERAGRLLNDQKEKRTCANRETETFEETR